MDVRGEYNLENSLYDIEIHNNLPHDQSMIFGKTIYCDICGQSHKDNCAFAFQDNVTLNSIISLMTFERELELTINWKSHAKVNFKVIESPSFSRINLNAPSVQSNESRS